MTHYTHVPLSLELSATAQEGYIIYSLTIGSLISIGKFCDRYCISVFTKYHVKIVKVYQYLVQKSVYIKPPPDAEPSLHMALKENTLVSTWNIASATNSSSR